ncbi:MAG: cytochrome c oxidase subunit II [Rhodospirillum sp.]|nr:cytochrome c oxidase subunit II [Rhodospirillum sp.]MCF8492025.1 cytochrome c oxidase subunit II [Rhodospirillum sp.]MCF8502250.1 cytochrome c oxidase subunit II [Rhodospirillum sp.]
MKTGLTNGYRGANNTLKNGLARHAVRTLPWVLGALALGVTQAQGAQPEPWQIGMQPAQSPVADQIHDLHWFITAIMIAVVLAVLGLLIYAAVRFNAKANPTPSTFSHNTKIEVVWTLVPVLILAAIAVPSFRLLYFMDRVQEAEMTLKVTGHQWYWSYDYPDQKEIAFDAFMVGDDDLKEGQLRLLTTDTQVVLPTKTNIRVLITADDVIHSWAMPALGLKTDAVPGRLNETWVRIEEEGTYYGQCSELCGVNHGFMPIEIKAVSRADFDGWVTTAAEEYGDPDAATITLADKPIQPVPGLDNEETEKQRLAAR